MKALQRRNVGVVLGLISLTVLALLSSAGGTDKKPQPKRLVWPLPPDKPRISFVTSIYGANDVEPVKANFLDKVAGIHKRDLKPAFLKPYGVTTDSKRRLYVSDSGQGIVYVFDREHHKVTYVGRTAQVRLMMPMGITVDGQDRLWVADSISQHVFAFDADGTVVMQLGREDVLKNPTGVAVDDSRHRVYVVDSKKHALVVFDSRTGDVLKEITGTDREEDDRPDFLFPTNVVVDRAGRVYVVDTMRYRVVVFDPDYEVVGVLGSQGNRLGQFLKPKGITLDSNNNIYVVDSEFNNFQIFDQKFRLLMFLGKFGVTPGTFVLPAGIHVDRQDFIYVVDQSNARVQIFQLLDSSVEETRPGTMVGKRSEPSQMQPTNSRGTRP